VKAPAPQSPATLDELIARLSALHPKRIDLGLERMARILDALDHPERHLPPVIHVAGTNGKGSTIAFMRAILEAAGKRVHVYTSPNLVRLNERFRIGRTGGGKFVGDEELARRLEQERNEYNRLMLSIEELCRKGALEQDPVVPSVFIVGVANLVSGEADGQRLRSLLSALETKQRLIELLDAYVDARQQSVRVVVGLEETIPEMRNLVLIGAPARLGTQSLGTVAVIGSTRIPYQETINAVSFIAQLSDRILPTQ